MLSEKEKLIEELRFLKESYDIGVITEEEYENGKRRIGIKIKDIEEKENEGDGLFKEEFQKTDEGRVIIYDAEDKEERQEKLDDVNEKERKDKKGTKPVFLRKKKELQQEEADEEIDQEIDEIIGGRAGGGKEQEEKEEEQDQTEEDIFPLDFEGKGEIREKKEKRKEEKYLDAENEFKFSKKTLIFAAVLIIAAFGAWYLFFTGNSDNANTMANNAATLIACYSDTDCKEQGKIGRCLNPGKENAECIYVDDIQVKLKIINSKKCFNCGNGRIISILEGFYPNLDIGEIDYDTAEGRVLADRLNINALPAYILNSSLSEAYNYDKFSTAFNKISDNFVMKNAVSNANYYLDRKEISNKLDLFVQEGQEASDKAEANLREFLEAFDGKVTFNKRNSDSALAKELGLNSFPAFLINNKIKFGGVQAANTIKENFCQINKLDECDLELSKSLV